MHEGARDVSNMDVVALEMRFEQDHEMVVDGAIYEIVDQQVDPHARRHAENRGEPQADRILAIEHDLLGFHLVAAIQRDRMERGFLGAEFSPFADAIAANGYRYDHPLRG